MEQKTRRETEMVILFQININKEIIVHVLKHGVWRWKYLVLILF